jgi:uncharacterized protein (UPF0297 family)
MIEIEQITKEWKSDCIIDDLNLDKENTRIPSLHSKYVGMMVDENRELRKLLRDRAILKRLLRSYYLGEAEESDLERLGRDQFYKKILKNELNEYLDTDKTMIVVNAKVSIAEEKVDVLKEIIRSVNNRGYQLKNAIDWHRLTMG